MKPIALVLTLGLLALSATADAKGFFNPKVTLSNTYDPTEVAWADEKGTGIVSGQAFVQTNGGVPRTCAGGVVTIWPVTKYAAERVTVKYGSPHGGYMPAWSKQGRTKFVPENPAFLAEANRRRAICDSQGNYKFENLAAGDYYVMAAITWMVEYSMNGGGIVRLVTVKPDETQTVMLVP